MALILNSVRDKCVYLDETFKVDFDEIIKYITIQVGSVFFAVNYFAIIFQLLGPIK